MSALELVHWEAIDRREMLGAERGDEQAATMAQAVMASQGVRSSRAEHMPYQEKQEQTAAEQQRIIGGK